MVNDDRLREFLTESYGIEGRNVIRKSERTVFVDTSRRDRVSIRLGSGASRIASSLRYLETRSYAAPKVILAKDGAALSSFDGVDCVVTDFVLGDQPTRHPSTVKALGEALGALHALGPVPALVASNGVRSPIADCIIPAEMLPSTELFPGLPEVIGASDPLPAEAAAYQADIIAMVSDLDDDFANLPQVLLHGDCHQRNAVLTPSRSAVFIDWDSAGSGPAVVDLGFILLSVGTGLLTGPPIPVNASLVQDLMRGYQRHRGLLEAEKKRLVHAIRFRALVYVVGIFLDDLRANRPPKPGQWWQRCTDAENIAAAALFT